eukprot:scaffold2850_cov119-Isochrysis_galbana.AAC.1
MLPSKASFCEERDRSARRMKGGYGSSDRGSSEMGSTAPSPPPLDRGDIRFSRALAADAFGVAAAVGGA